MSSPIPAVAYYRMSTDRQEASIPAQREAVRAYAARNALAIVREYTDEGISGDATEKRLGFQRMLHDATERRDFHAVLCWDMDRFGRFDPLDAGYWIKPLRDAGIRLETVAQGRIDWNDFAGRIVYAVQQEGKHAFLRDMSRNTTRGMLAKAKAGFWLGGPAPYGYRLDSGKLVIVDAAAEIVRWLFRAYARGSASLGDLARQLNERGVAGPGGGMWYKTTVHKILCRPCYCGDTVWNRRHDGKYHEVKGGEISPTLGRGSRTRKVNAEAEWIVVRDTHAPLVERETFATVQRCLRERQGLKTPCGAAFVFTGLVYCMQCGSPMHGCTNVQHKRDKKGSILEKRHYHYRRYICGRYNAFGSAGCSCNTIPEQHLLNAVVKRVQQDFLSPDNLTLLRAEMARQIEAERPAAVPVKRLRARLAELSRQIERGAERMLAAPEDLTDTLAATMRCWQQERDEVQAQLQASEKPCTAAKAEPTKKIIDRAIACLWALRERLNTADPGKAREVVRQSVSRVECWFDHVPYGKTRKRSVLNRGMIHLRPDVLVSRDVTRARPLTIV